MEKMTLKAYAQKKKLSLFSVVKMMKSKEIESQKVTEDGEEVIYILVDKTKESATVESLKPIQTPLEKLKEENQALKQEIASLKEEISVLKSK